MNNEPVAHFYPEGDGCTVFSSDFAFKYHGTKEPIPLYTHQQVTPSRLFGASEPVYPAKTLTDEEFISVYTTWCLTSNDPLVLKQAILRKAQEK